MKYNNYMQKIYFIKSKGGVNIIKRWIKPILVLILILLSMNLIVRDYLPTFQKAEKPLVIVIDPGHGGNDPGKVGINNALEKDINLSIALKLKSYFEMQGIAVIMTRETDDGLYEEGVRNKKKSDLQARVKLCNESKAALVISIHQNSYQTENCKGAQVFYFEESKDGQELAGYIQQSIVLNVDPENKRKIKANSSYFMLKETAVTTVIVECGFLSNSEEAELLNSEDYQTKIAYGIHAGVVAYLNMVETPEGNQEDIPEVNPQENPQENPQDTSPLDLNELETPKSSLQ